MNIMFRILKLSKNILLIIILIMESLMVAYIKKMVFTLGSMINSLKDLKSCKQIVLKTYLLILSYSQLVALKYYLVMMMLCQCLIQKI